MNTEKQEWEERFDEKFPRSYFMDSQLFSKRNGYQQPKEIKSFIAIEKALSYQEALADIRAWAEEPKLIVRLIDSQVWVKKDDLLTHLTSLEQ